MSKRYLTGSQAEVRQRLLGGERVTGPHPHPVRNGFVRPFAWPNGSSVHTNTVRAMIEAGEVTLVPLGGDRHELVLA